MGDKFAIYDTGPEDIFVACSSMKRANVGEILNAADAAGLSLPIYILLNLFGILLKAAASLFRHLLHRGMAQLCTLMLRKEGSRSKVALLGIHLLKIACEEVIFVFCAINRVRFYERRNVFYVFCPKMVIGSYISLQPCPRYL